MRPFALAGLVGLAVFAATLVAQAQTPPDPPAICTSLRTQWNEESASADAGAMRAFLVRVPATCRNLRRRIERYIVQRFPPATPPTQTTTRPTSTTIETPTWRAGQEFDDCNGAGWCPTMVVIPAGQLVRDRETGAMTDQAALRSVSIRQFSVGKFEVTFDQWAACVGRGGCTGNANPSDAGWGRGNRPVINVSWDDAQEYVRWLSRSTGQTYRLLTEAEWEYAARAGTATPLMGEGIYASGGWFASEASLPVGSFPANSFGLHDMQGNVYEWGDVRTNAFRSDYPYNTTPSNHNTLGFRVARTLN